MLSKEEYKKNLIRMFDSLRTEYKGEENCMGVNCGDCPLFKDSCYGKWSRISNFRVYESIEIVENWSKEHPVMTNADKFRELFGVQPPSYACVNNVDCENCDYHEDSGCNVYNRFWNKEYKWPMVLIL